MEEIEPILDALGKYPPLEREKIRKIMLSLRDKDTLEANEALELVCACVLAGGRSLSKRQSDAKTDPPRRVLVGARVKRKFGEQCKAAAQARGISLYAWVCEALERALEAQWMD